MSVETPLCINWLKKHEKQHFGRSSLSYLRIYEVCILFLCMGGHEIHRTDETIEKKFQNQITWEFL